MQKHFYTHIVEIDSIYAALDEIELGGQEKQELILIVESHVHQVVVDTVLSELSEEDKKIFLMYLAHNRHDEVWDHLKKNIENVEGKIKKAVDDLKKDLHTDIKESKVKK